MSSPGLPSELSATPKAAGLRDDDGFAFGAGVARLLPFGDEPAALMPATAAATAASTANPIPIHRRGTPAGYSGCWRSPGRGYRLGPDSLGA